MRLSLLTRLAAVPLVLSTLISIAPRAAVAAAAPTKSTCQFRSPSGSPNAIQHVIHIQFNNVHFSRDNPDVPSDLEQMPHLLNFLESQGVVLANNHTVMISHTAYGLLSG